MQDQAIDNLINFIGQCRENLDPTRKHRFSGGIGRGSYGVQSGLKPRSDHVFHGITRTVTLLVVVLKVVLEGVAPSEWDIMTDIMAETEVREGVKVTTYPPPPTHTHTHTKTDRGSGAAARIIGKEVGWREYDRNGDGE